MSLIYVKDLKRHFKLLNRREGLLGSFKDLFSRDYQTIKAVDGITMNIEEGEIVGFIGPNGAGKSTTIKMLTGVLEPTEGDISILEYVPYKQRQKYVHNIGVVMGQRTQLWWDLPVIESFKLLKEIYCIDKKEYESNLKIFNDLVNLQELYLKPVRNLSLGQRMLCDIAASFLHNPKIIFLDEPTIGLDISIKKQVRKIIKNLNEIKRTTIILTSHDIGDIEELSKRIILIDKGVMLYDGDIKKFNMIFGRYRTLRLDLEQSDISLVDKISNGLNKKIKTKEQVVIKRMEDGWFEITINQDEIALLDILNYLMTNFKVKDIMVEEIKMEQVISKVYAGALL